MTSVARPALYRHCEAAGRGNLRLLDLPLPASYNQSMPTISMFYGILIRMYFNDHAPAHFHVQYAE